MKLSIIILNYNTKDLLSQTIDSIILKPDYELIVVDNASTDDSVNMVKTRYPHILLIESDKNLGFAAGNNIGINQSQGEYVMLLNSDTQIVDNALEELINYMDIHQDIGMISPQIVLPDGGIDLACHRGLPTPWNAFTYFTKLEQLFPNTKLFGGYHQTYQDFSSIHEVEATACTASITRKKVIDEVGGLDERFFFYAEDLDWCKRIHEAGYKIIYYPLAKVVHYKSQSGKKNLQDKQKRQQAAMHFYQTMKQFYDKHYSDKYPKWLRQLVFWGIDIKQKLHR